MAGGIVRPQRAIGIIQTNWNVWEVGKSEITFNYQFRKIAIRIIYHVHLLSRIISTFEYRENTINTFICLHCKQIRIKLIQNISLYQKRLVTLHPWRSGKLLATTHDLRKIRGTNFFYAI